MEDRLAVVTALRATLHVELTTSIVQPTTAAQLYEAVVQVSWSPDDGPDVDSEALSELMRVDTDIYLPELSSLLPDTITADVGHGDFVAADLGAPDCLQELEDIGPGVGLVGKALYGEGLQCAELSATFELVHQRAIIAAHMQIDPPWRGAGYGLLATELVLAELGRAADVAALFPMKPGLDDLAERDAAARALADYWGRIGFVEFNGIMAMALPVASG
ncbi:MAG: hypothetical protein E6Q90_14125 [Actinobacteria bacterium]|nr:MAG: hypothetical protein E6Q90_14125 [Actinomycetota bacterium]